MDPLCLPSRSAAAADGVSARIIPRRLRGAIRRDGHVVGVERRLGEFRRKTFLYDFFVVFQNVSAAHVTDTVTKASLLSVG